MRKPTGVSEPALLADLWGPRLVSFYYLLCADQPAAETLAIETIAELVRARRWHRDTAAIVGRALARATALPPTRPTTNDPLVLAIASLPRRDRCLIASVRALGVGINDFAEAAGVGVHEANRNLAEAMLALHKLLFPRCEDRNGVAS